MPRRIGQGRERQLPGGSVGTESTGLKGIGRTIPPTIRARLADSGDLRQVRRHVPSRSDAERISRIFDAVSDPARLRILATLARAPLCPCLVREIQPMKNPVLSYHLRVLRRAGLVTMSAKSNYRIYEASALGETLVSFARGLLRPKPGSERTPSF